MAPAIKQISQPCPVRFGPRAMMRRVVTSGTAAGVFDGLTVTVAGKTGSAKVGSGRTHSWFAGFAPADSPRLAFACIVEHGGAGRAAAAPVCREIVKAYAAEAER